MDYCTVTIDENINQEVSSIEDSHDSLTLKIKEMLCTRGDKTALSELGRKGRTDYSYRQLWEESSKLSMWLRSEGLKGKGIGVLGDNSCLMLVVTFAAWLSGNYVIFFDKFWNKKEFSYSVNHSDCEYIFIQKTYLSLVEGNSDIGSLKVFRFDEIKDYVNGELHTEEPADTRIGFMDDDRALVLFSSGTTDMQKAICVSRKAVVSRFVIQSGLFNFPVPDTLLSLPMYHSWGFNTCMAGLNQGKRVFLNISFKYLIRDIYEVRPPFLCMLPSQVPQVMDAFREKGKPYPTNRIVIGGVAVQPALAVEIHQMGITLLSCYGSSETGHMAVGECAGHSFGYTGRLNQGMEITINEPDEKGIGELIVKSPGLFSYYIHNEQLTEAAFMNGGYRTGDLGYMDAERGIYLIGRIKNLIILQNGEKISPELLEKELKSYSVIRECVVCEKEGRLVAEIFAESDLEGEDLAEELDRILSSVNKKQSVTRQLCGWVLRKESFKTTNTGKVRR